MCEKSLIKPNSCVRFYKITESESEQRIDNFLLKQLKKVPRSYIYRIIRKGEVRVNKKRIKAKQKLKLDDIVRIPPVKNVKQTTINKASDKQLERISQRILYEDENLIFIDKPSGLAVHGGTGVYIGLIELFRQLRPNLPFVELVHRLDKDTSGIVMLAKTKPILNEMHTLLRAGKIEKHYQTLVSGQWQGKRKVMVHKLSRNATGKHQHKIQINDHGKIAKTIFTPESYFQEETLLNVQILTGRMHQIRVQLSHLNYPIIGDSRYGNFSHNRKYKKLGLNRLFLHAQKLNFYLPSSGKKYLLSTTLPNDLQQTIQKLRKIHVRPR